MYEMTNVGEMQTEKPPTTLIEYAMEKLNVLS